MKILVAIKQVPARDSQLKIASSARWIAEEDLTYEINEPDAYALEEGLQLKEKHGGEVIALCFGPARSGQTIREALAKEPVEKVIPALLKSKEEGVRRLGVVALGAIDDLPGLAGAFNNTEYADVRDNVITIVRQWLGRAPGQDQKFYDFLVEYRKFPPAHAMIAMRLLHSFSEADLALLTVTDDPEEVCRVVREFARAEHLGRPTSPG